MKSKLLQGVVLTGAAFSLVACSPTQSADDNKQQEKNADNKKDTKEIKTTKALSEDEYVEQITKQSYKLVSAFYDLADVIPDNSVIEESDTKIVINKAKEIYPIVEKIKSINPPEKYEKVQEKYVAGANELSKFTDDFIDEWESLVYVDMQSTAPHLEKALEYLEEAEEELAELYEDEESSINEMEEDLDSMINDSDSKSSSKSVSTSNSSYSVSDLKGTWDYLANDNRYINLTLYEDGSADKYEEAPDGSSTSWSGNWHLDGNTIVIDVDEAYKGMDIELSDYDKELRFEIESKTDKTLTVKHQGRIIPLEFLY